MSRGGQGNQQLERGISVLAVACHHETTSLLVINDTDPVTLVLALYCWQQNVEITAALLQIPCGYEHLQNDKKSL